MARLAPTIILAGLAGAAIDGAYASALGVIRDIGVMRVWQGVAGGWMGPAAREGGVATALLGIVTHIAIAQGMAAVFILALARLEPLRRHRWAAATAYGLGLYAVMYLLVLPLRWPEVFPRWTGLYSLTDIAAHIAVAMAIAAVARGRGV